MTRGAWMFARYAYAPNKLGYCGPPDAVTMAGSEGDVRAVARRFSGAWPYLRVMARMTGIEDPLDHRLVESYWLGGGVGARLSGSEFGAELLAVIGPQAGHYWTHLTPELLAEASGDHCFHVFGVYPWSRLLGSGAAEPLRVLDSCRIRWGTVLSREGDRVEVLSRRLTWDGARLGLGKDSVETVEGLGFLPDVTPGDRVALHWDWLTDRLRADQAETLEASTLRQLEATNRRLAG